MNLVAFQPLKFNEFLILFIGLWTRERKRGRKGWFLWGFQNLGVGQTY